MNYFLEYKDISRERGYQCFTRFPFPKSTEYEDRGVSVFYSKTKQSWFATACGPREFRKKEIAMAAMDAVLLSNGFKFITYKQAEKVVVLL